jgi:ATP-dependent Clp protease ATP-binding subunit ClpB
MLFPCQGHTVSFKNTVIIMTSNLGSSEIYAQLEGEEKEGKAPLSDDERRAIVKEKVMEHVR